MSRLSALLFKLLWKDDISVYYAVEHTTSCFWAGLACDNQWREHVRTSCYQLKALFVIPVLQQLYLLQQSVDTVQNVLIICMVNTHISHIWEHTPPSPRGSFWSNIYVPKHQKLLKDQLLCILIFLFIFKGNMRIDVDACCECQAAEAVWKREGEAEIRG